MVRRSGKLLIIEGTRDDTNGSLGIAFTALLMQKLHGKMPHIIMGENTPQTIKKFVNSHNGKIPHALIDLDGKGPEVEAGNYAPLKEQRKSDLSIEGFTRIFFMVQKMEAWFISQPKVLSKYYREDLSSRITQKHGSKFQDPVGELQNIVRVTNRRYYLKVQDGSRLIAMLDLQNLMNDFEDVNQLIEALSN